MNNSSSIDKLPVQLRWPVRFARGILINDGLIAYPTEAVFGLGCLPDSYSTVERLLDVKQRPIDKGLILVAASWPQLTPYLQPVPDNILTKVMASWPGPYTWLLPAKQNIPKLIRGEHKTLAVRISAHPVVRALCQALNSPLISTSANISSRSMTYTPFQVRLQFGNQLDYILNAPLGQSSQPSRIIDAMTGAIVR